MSSSASILSDSDTLVDPESPISPSTERLLAKAPHDTVDQPGFGGSDKQGWTFRRLMAYRPIQVMSVTMFLSSYVGRSACTTPRALL
jgi:hypothetical protein